MLCNAIEARWRLAFKYDAETHLPRITVVKSHIVKKITAKSAEARRGRKKHTRAVRDSSFFAHSASLCVSAVKSMRIY